MNKSFTFPQTTWDAIWINEGAVLMSTTGTSEAVKKTFRMKVGDMERIAFYVPGKTGLTTSHNEFKMTTNIE